MTSMVPDSKAEGRGQFLFSVHNHTHYSNLRLIDSINFPDELIKHANNIGLAGISLSDHETLSGHMDFLLAYKNLKKNGELRDKFKIAFGNEIYLVKEDTVEELRENYRNKERDTQFYHFLLTALDPIGYEQLKKLSTLAWKNAFRTGLMMRVPTFKHDLKRIVKGGHIAATSACLGGFLPQMILRWLHYEECNNKSEAIYYKKQIHDFILFCIDVFGKDKFFFEIQPSDDEKQHIVNKKLIELSKVYEVDFLVATDAHFLTKEDRQAHKVYLQSSEGEREVDEFYSSCYVFSVKEIYESMKSHLTVEEIRTAIDNTMKIYEMVELYDLEKKTIIPHAEIKEFELNHLFKPAYDKFPYIKKYAYSDHEIDRYCLFLIEEGFKEQYPPYTLSKKYFYTIMERIDMELKELWLISDRLGDRMSSYYVLTKQIVDIMWTKGDSIVPPGRGSAAGYLTNKLLKITQVDPIYYELPHFRHLTAERPELPDIDLDTEQSKRGTILQALKDVFGENKVLNIATFSKEGSRSALLSACRGLGIDVDEASYMTNLIPTERGRTWTLSECYFGDGKDKKPVKELVETVESFEGLKEISLKIEGLIKNNSVHASGIYIFNNDYTKQNAMMKSSKGLETTQFDMKNSDLMGALKIDALTVQNVDKIRVCLDWLVKDGYIDWQGDLRKTYNKYLHPNVLDYDDPKMWEKVANNDIPDLFQFDTEVGLQCAQKVKPTSVEELAMANNLMRLKSDDGIQPVDKYILYRDNPELWIKEMKEYGLSDKEISIVKEHLQDASGVSNSQEEIMLLSMDKRIANFSIIEANTLRKAVAKIDPEILLEVKNNFFNKGRRVGTSDNLLNYIWDKQIMPQSGYGFSKLHSISYSLIALQNMNLAHKYPSVYWDTACLTVNSGAGEDNDSDKSSDYGKIASSIGDMQNRGVKVVPPDINKAGFSFTPDPKNNSVLFGLKGLVGIGDEIALSIIANRPYDSFKHFLQKMFVTKKVQNTHVLQLIKAGAFDSFGNRKDIMSEYLNYVFEPRKSLNMQSFNTVLKLGIIPEEYYLQVRFYRFRDYIFKNKYGRLPNRKTQNRLFLLNDFSAEFLYEHFSDKCIHDYKDGLPIVAEHLFNKEYNKKIEPIKEWLAKKETVELVNKKLFDELWDKSAKGTIGEWEMSSLSYYYTEHELEHLDTEKYDVSNFNNLPKEPTPIKEYEYKGRTRYEYKLDRIAGTVLDKDKNRHTVTILTTTGVVTVKLYRNSYSYLDKQISKVDLDGKKTVVEKSWFTRGNKLLLTGFRRGNQFVPRVYRNSIYQHPVTLIDSIDPKGNLSLITERTQV